MSKLSEGEKPEGGREGGKGGRGEGWMQVCVGSLGTGSCGQEDVVTRAAGHHAPLTCLFHLSVSPVFFKL